MKARDRFASFSDHDLVCWWGQYGVPSMACHYRSAPRRAAWTEMKKRGLAVPEANRSTYISGYPRPQFRDVSDAVLHGHFVVFFRDDLYFIDHRSIKLRRRGRRPEVVSYEVIAQVNKPDNLDPWVPWVFHRLHAEFRKDTLMA